MAHARSVSFANFVCRFGESHVMLDLAEEVVIPALVMGGQRMYGESRFIIQDGELIDYGTSKDRQLVIVGRLIRDTVLSRDQILQNGKLVKSKATMPSAPSAIFALILDTHKLLYLPETPHAPSLSAFQATAASVIKNRHRDFLDALYERGKKEGKQEGKKRITRKALLETLPYPTVEVVPLSSTDDFKRFLGQFGVLQQVRIDIIDTNNETDGLELVEAARDIKNGIAAKNVSIAYRNPKGLKLRHAFERFVRLAEDGITKLSLAGLDKGGDDLRGNNENFKVAVEVEQVSGDPVEVGRQLFKLFTDKVKSGFVKIQPADAEVRARIGILAKKLIG